MSDSESNIDLHLQLLDADESPFFVAQWPSDEVSDMDTASVKVVFPGSFNPVHEGHLAIADFARAKTNQSIWFEFSILNADKIALPSQKVAALCGQDIGVNGLLVTRSATFVEKAKLFPEVTFLVGADTVRRIGDIKYYDNNRIKFKDSINFISDSGCRFLVFARKIDNIMIERENLELDPLLAGICEFVPSQQFAVEVSSAKLRTNLGE